MRSFDKLLYFDASPVDVSWDPRSFVATVPDAEKERGHSDASSDRKVHSPPKRDDSKAVSACCVI